MKKDVEKCGQLCSHAFRYVVHHKSHTLHMHTQYIVTFIIIKNLDLYETFNFSNVHENFSLACLTCNFEYLSTHRLFIVVCSILVERITNNEISNALVLNCKSCTVKNWH